MKKETIENILSELLKDEGGPAIIYFPVSENSIFFWLWIFERDGKN